MQNTTHYNLTKAEGTDTVNLLTQCYPNFDTIDAAMFANKQGSIGTATEVTTGTVHAITRANPDSDVFRFTATSAWAAGDTMTLDGTGVTVHLADGTTPASGAYIIGAEVLGVVNGSLVTLFLSSAIQAYVSSFNSRSGAVSPAASDYDASMIDYDNTLSGLNATDAQGAIDEMASSLKTATVAFTKNETPSRDDVFDLVKSGNVYQLSFENVSYTNSYSGDHKIATVTNPPLVKTRFMLCYSNGTIINCYIDTTGGVYVYNYTGGQLMYGQCVFIAA